MSVAVEALKDVPLLSGLDTSHLSRLAGDMRERSISAGDCVVREGTAGIGFFVVLDGEAEVTRDGDALGTLKTGDHFGEIALFVDGMERTATVTAKTDVKVAALTAWNFRPFVRAEPDVAWLLLEGMAKQLAAPRH